MAALRLVPVDGKEFPYDAAKKLILLDNPGVQFEKADLTPMIEKGRSIGWTEGMIKANKELNERGKCYSFVMTEAPYIRGTLFEDNVWLEIDPNYIAESEIVLNEWIQILGVAVLEN